MNDTFLKIWNSKWVFFSTFFVILTLSYIVLIAIDFVPEQIVVPETENIESSKGASVMSADDEVEQLETSATDEVGVKTEVTDSADEENSMSENILGLPVSINIKKLKKTVSVLNPTSRSISQLDEALLSGAVRHPDSAALGQDGNVFILAHSSYLPKVFNKNFQAFNGIQDLEWGDEIEVSSDDSVYTYRVEKVYRAKAQNVTVPIAGDVKKLTLATCNSFGSSDDRYIVEAQQTSMQRL